MIEVKRADGYLYTEGLATLGAAEIVLHEVRTDWRDDAEQLLAYIAKYVTSAGRTIHAEETMNYGFWLIKFVAHRAKTLEVHEYNETGAEFIPGARLSMEFWRDQHNVCRRANAAFAPPRPDELVAVSPDLVEAPVIEAVRHELGHGQSGWIMTSEGFEGPVQSLRQEHLLHLVSSRRDILRYVALPVGFRFVTNDGSTVWFDQSVGSRKLG